MRRRAFLAGAAATVATACVPGQVVSSSPSPSASPAPSPTSPPPVTPSPSPTARVADWNALAASLRGTLVRPSDAAYDSVRVLYNTRFDAVRPQGIARCADERDVQACVRFTRDAGVPLRVRSGGHSYIGASSGSGLVVDLRPMSAVSIAGTRATIGAGAALIDAYDALSSAGRGIAAGSCPTVGISGLTLGGGIGVLTRAWGLTCDQLASARVVLADGSAVTCDANNEPALFWALRGGGGSFGAVTSLTFDTHRAAPLGIAFYSWDSADAAAAIDGWQRWMQDAPDEIWSNVHVSSAGASVHVVSPFYGSALGARLDNLSALVGRSPSYRESGVRAFDEVMLLEAGCLGATSGQCHLHGATPDGVLNRESFTARSIVAGAPLSAAAITKLLERGRASGAGDVLIDSLGGAVSRVAPDATAFPHRGAFAVLQLYAGGAPTAWLNDTFTSLRPLIGTGAYANYGDADLTDWQAAYYGANYARLQQVKRQYDPGRLFDGPQAI
ncbi:MAG TPA: FAD-binding oxidoreductase [Candidatus Acidoferrales bacterium]|nr:FAD-binding oxidoreductase [Candidatus Acidoferrales bacterium]